MTPRQTSHDESRVSDSPVVSAARSAARAGGGQSCCGWHPQGPWLTASARLRMRHGTSSNAARSLGAGIAPRHLSFLLSPAFSAACAACAFCSSPKNLPHAAPTRHGLRRDGTTPHAHARARAPDCDHHQHDRQPEEDLQVNRHIRSDVQRGEHACDAEHERDRHGLEEGEDDGPRARLKEGDDPLQGRGELILR